MKTQMNATTLVAMIKEANSHVKPSEIQALTISNWFALNAASNPF